MKKDLDCLEIIFFLSRIIVEKKKLIKKMTKQEIGEIAKLTSNWLYHEQEINRGSDKDYHTKEQLKNERLLIEIMTNIVKNRK